eukprot:5716785-Alexandrium_andersonii.AAC.1
MAQNISSSTKTTAVWMTLSLCFQMAVCGSDHPSSRQSPVHQSQDRGIPGHHTGRITRDHPQSREL